MLSKKIAYGTAWLFLGRLVSRGAGLAGMLIIARLLTPADFGLIALAAGVMFIVAAMIELPTAAALVQHEDPQREDFDTAFTLSVLRGLLVFVVLFALAGPIAAFYDDPRLVDLMRVFALYPLILGFRNAHFESFARDLQFNREFVMEVGAKLAAFVLSVWIAFEFRTYWALAASQLAYAATAVVMTFAMRPVLPRFTLKSWRRILRFSVWLGASSIVKELNWKSDDLLIGRFLGPATLGVYSVGRTLAGQFTQMMIAPAVRSLFSGFSRIQDDEERRRRAFLAAQSVMVAAILPVGVTLGILAEPFVAILLGNQWEGAVIVVAVAAPLGAMMTMTAPVTAFGMSLGRTRSLFFRDCIALAVRLPLIIGGLILFALPGVLAGRALAGVFMLGINLSLLRQFAGVSVLAQLRNVSRTVAAVAVMAGLLLILPRPDAFEADTLALIFLVGAQAAAGFATYGLVHFALWAASGRPEGLETRVLRLAVRLRAAVAPG